MSQYGLEEQVRPNWGEVSTVDLSDETAPLIFDDGSRSRLEEFMMTMMMITMVMMMMV